MQNSISFEGADDNGSFRIGYTNAQSDGILPNSQMYRNSATFRGTRDFGKLTADASISFINTQTTGRFGTGTMVSTHYKDLDNGGLLEQAFLNKKEFLKKLEKTILGI